MWPIMKQADEDKKSKRDKMVKINVVNFSEEELEKWWSELRNKKDWDEECEMCERPVMLHEEKCTRKKEVGEDEYGEICREWCWFKEKMNSIKKS